MKRFLPPLIVALSLAPSLPAGAQDENAFESIRKNIPKIREDSDKLKVSIAKAKDREERRQTAPPSGQVFVDDPWTDSTRQRVYEWDGPVSKIGKISGEILFESPVPVEPILAPLMDPFPGGRAREIAAACRQRFGENWDRIGCVSRAVKDFFRGFKFDNLRSFCRSHAQAFEVTFFALDIDETWATKVDASGPLGTGHVANAILIHDKDGATYSYVIDSGWFPGRLFPLNDGAVRFHDRNDDGRTDFRDLPIISEHPFHGYRAAP